MAKSQSLIEIITTFVSKGVDQAKDKLNGLKATASDVSGHINGVFAALGISLATTGLFKWLIDVNTEFQKLQTQIRTLSATQGEADAAFAWMRKFAVQTPFELKDVTEAYTILRSAGLHPTEQMMTSLGNLASASARNVVDLAGALRSASVGITRELHGFNIVAHQNNNKMTVSFHGLKEKIGTDAQSIANYLTRLSDSHFAGAMEREMKTLGGAISNLKDAFFNAGTSVGEAGFTGQMIDAISAMTTLIDRVREVNDLLNQSHKEGRESAEQALSATEERLKLLRGWVNDDHRERFYDKSMTSDQLDARFKAGLGNSTEGLKTEREREYLSLLGQRKELEKELGSIAHKNTTAAIADSKEALAANAKEDKLKRSALELEQLTKAREEYLKNADARMKLTEATDALWKSEHDWLFGALRVMEAIVPTMTEYNEAERKLTQFLGMSNLKLAERVKLMEQLAAVQEKRAALVASMMRGGKDNPVGQYDTSIETGLKDLNTALESGGAPGARIKAPTVSAGEVIMFKIGRAISDAHDKLRALYHDLADKSPFDVLSDALVGMAQSYGGAVEQVFAEVAAGTASLGEAITSALGSALSAVARKFGDYFMALALGGAAQGFLGFPQGFAAQAAAVAAATAMYALAGAVSGSTRSFGGGHSGGGAFSASPGLGGASATTSGDTVINIPGGLLDLNNPRVAQLFAEALNQARGRRIIINNG